MLVNTKEIIELWENEHGRECSEVEKGNFIVEYTSTNMGVFYKHRKIGFVPESSTVKSVTIEWRGATPYLYFE